MGVKANQVVVLRAGHMLKTLAFIAAFACTGCVRQDDDWLKKVTELESSLQAVQGQLSAAEERIDAFRLTYGF